MDGRLAGGISQLTLLASTRAWVCPTLADQPILGAVGRAAGPWGRWEALACPAGPPVKGGGPTRQQEAPLKTLASPWSVPTQPTTPTVGGGTAPFLAVTVPILLPSPRAGRKYLVLLVLGTGSKHCET